MQHEFVLVPVYQYPSGTGWYSTRVVWVDDEVQEVVLLEA
jgi:hypothetical protein